MMDNIDKKCIKCNIEIPGFIYSNERQRLDCSDCKKCSMINIKDKKCISCNLSQANKEYTNHCAFCFINLFPNEPKSIIARTSR